MSKKNSRKISQPVQKIKAIGVSYDTDGVVCGGATGGLGHPRVWYGFNAQGLASCHYCGRKFSKTTAQ